MSRETLYRKIAKMFTQRNQFNHFMRLNFALQWDDRLEFDLKRLGKIVKQAL